MRLDQFSSGDFDRGASRLQEAAWIIVSALLFSTWIPGSGWRCSLLRLFGGSIGTKVVIKPGVKIKFPWRLIIGDFSWIGERVWIDNLGEVSIGAHACLSQGTYLCTGSHDWSSEGFDLMVRPISVGDHAWLGAFSMLAPGTEVGEGAVLAIGGVGKGKLASWTVHGGNPAQPIRARKKGEHSEL